MISLFLTCTFFEFYGRYFESLNCSFSFRQKIGDFYINNCVFYLFSLFNGNGGVISQENIITFTLIENSLFYNCSVISTFHGGAIYFYCLNGEFSFRNICAFNCFSSNHWDQSGQFCYLSVSIDSNNMI